MTVDGRSDALSRIARRSDDPEYEQAYLDGLFERARTAQVTGFRDRTIDGLVFEVTATADGARWEVTDSHTGSLRSGLTTDVETGVAMCEGVARSMGRHVARLSEIRAQIDAIHPAMDERTKARLASMAADKLLERKAS